MSTFDLHAAQHEVPTSDLTTGQRVDLLDHVLRDVDLGDSDTTVLGWLARRDTPTLRVVASLLARARDVGAAGQKRPCPTCGAVPAPRPFTAVARPEGDQP